MWRNPMNEQKPDLLAEEPEKEIEADLSIDADSSAVSEVPDKQGDLFTPASNLSIFFNWLGKQSIPRILGLLVGNTRDLENQIKSKDEALTSAILLKDGEIIFLRKQLVKANKRLTFFQDSVLLAKGMKSTQKSQVWQKPESTVVAPTPGQNMAIESEISRLQDVFIYRTNDIDQELADLLAINTPRSKMVYKRFVEWVDALPINDSATDGTVISS